MESASADCRFPEALRRALCRPDVSFPDILVGLARADVMRQYPPVQFMMQSLPQSGFFRPLMGASTAEDIDRLAGEFSLLTGYGSEASRYLFRSFAYARGLLAEIPVIPSAPDFRGEIAANSSEAVAEPEATYGESGTTESGRWSPYWSRSEKLRRLNSLMEIQRDNEKALGAMVASAACVEVLAEGFKLSAELRKVRPDCDCALACAVYGHDGHVHAAMPVGRVGATSPPILPRLIAVDCPPSDVGRIMLYWE